LTIFNSQVVGLIQGHLSGLNLSVLQNYPLQEFTTIGIGGPARLLVQTRNAAELEQVIAFVNQNKIPFRVIGHGSNVIISDDGLDELVIINQSENYKVLTKAEANALPGITISQYSTVPMQLRDLSEKKEDTDGNIVVRVDSGTRLEVLIDRLFELGIFGLEWFAGIPATVGGAIYMNMHHGRKSFGSVVRLARLIDEKSAFTVSADYFQFRENYSLLQDKKAVVLWADLLLKKGDVMHPRQIAGYNQSQKSVQPQRSAGIAFRNLSEEQRIQLSLPTNSAGYLIDRILGLKGAVSGGAKISEVHAAFIENTGKATARDVFDLFHMVSEAARSKTGIVLVPEITFIGRFK